MCLGNVKNARPLAHPPIKGKVKTKNGAILDVDVHSVVSMFP